MTQQYLVPGLLCGGSALQPQWEDDICRLLAQKSNLVGQADPGIHEGSELDAEVRLLASLAYGEASAKNVFEEMAAIANVLVRQVKARGLTTVQSLVAKDKNFAYAANDGNARYSSLQKASSSTIHVNTGMHAALEAASNALSGTAVDYSNGAFFWDGADIKSNYDNHPKVAKGIRFTSSEHNIYKLQEKKVPGTGWWQNAKRQNTQIRGSWDYVYESTAAWGGTIFWRYTQDFVKATGARSYQ